MDKRMYEQLFRLRKMQVGPVVREREILRLSAKIGGSDSVQAADMARKEILKWVEKRCGAPLPTQAWRGEGFEYLKGGRTCIGLRLASDDSELWALRADDPDKVVAGRAWTTEVVIGFRDGQPLLGVRLLAASPEDKFDIEPHVPGFVLQIIARCGLWAGEYQLLSEPRIIDSDYAVRDLVDMLVKPERQIPVFVLSVPESVHEPLLDPRSLARATAGLAHVAILPAQYTWHLTEEFGRKRSVFGGAVRVYFPGFTVDCDPYEHKLILADDIQSAEGRERWTRWLRNLAAHESIRRFRLGRDVLAFSDIKSAVLDIKQKELIEWNASYVEQLKIEENQIEILSKQINELKDEANFYDTEYDKVDKQHRDVRA